jgi:HK97 family phage portal protein
MGIVVKLTDYVKRTVTRLSAPTSFSLRDSAAALFLGASSTRSGRNVTAHTALEVSAVLACVRVIAEGVAQLPLHVVDKDELAKHNHKVTPGPLYDLLSEAPNDYQTSYEFREAMTTIALLCGDAYALPMRSGGRVTELIPLLPGECTIDETSPLKPRYMVTIPGLKTMVLEPKDIVHLRGFAGLQRHTGTPIFKAAREAIGLAMATEDTHARLHANGVRPSGILTTDAELSPETAQALAERFASAYAGGDNTGKTVVLDSGGHYTPISLNGVDAQHLETRRFQINEICRVFGVFPQMIMAGEGTSTYASVEAFFGAHLLHTINPWLERWRGTLNRDVLTFKSKVRVWFDPSQMQQAPLAVQTQFLSTSVLNGVITRNEARQRLGYAPLEGLDEPLTPANVATTPATPTDNTPLKEAA